MTDIHNESTIDAVIAALRADPDMPPEYLEPTCEAYDKVLRPFVAQVGDMAKAKVSAECAISVISNVVGNMLLTLTSDMLPVYNRQQATADASMLFQHIMGNVIEIYGRAMQMHIDKELSGAQNPH